MPRSKSSDKSPRAAIYQEVTDRVIALLESGQTPPWMVPWSRGQAPTSGATGKPYRGINVVILTMAAMSRGFDMRDPRFFTFGQAKAQAAKEAIRAGVDLEERTSARGGTYWVHRDTGRAFMGGVRKGEHGERVVWMGRVERKGKGEGEAPEGEGEGEGKSFWVMRAFTVFHVSQIEGVTPKIREQGAEVEPHEEAERIASAYLSEGGPAITFGGDRACYSPSSDRISMPERSRFVSAEAYYSTLFHEIGHSTGSERRLARKGVTDPIMFGSHTYAQEELVAEFTATFLCGASGVARAQTERQSAAYLRSWAGKLRDDPKVLVYAAQQAQHAADLVLGAGEDGEDGDDGEDGGEDAQAA